MDEWIDSEKPITPPSPKKERIDKHPTWTITTTTLKLWFDLDLYYVAQVTLFRFFFFFRLSS